MHFGDYPVISGVGPAGFTFLSATLSTLASVLMLATAKLAATSLPLKMVSSHFALGDLGGLLGTERGLMGTQGDS